jgi:hypothetical protein
MDGIETRIFCPECHTEVSILLKRHEVPAQLLEFMKSIGLPAGNDISYKGQKQCSCGKYVKVTFVMEAMENPDSADVVITGGIIR